MERTSSQNSKNLRDAGSETSQNRGFAPQDRCSAEMVSLVYDRLRALAGARLAAEPAGITLQATALVHEAFLRLMNQPDSKWDGPRHFYAAAAESMRRILIDNARKRASLKRGGDRRRVPIENNEGIVDHELHTLLALEEALDRLREQDPRMHEVVMLRYFAGQSVERTAELIGVAPRTVKRDWAVARAWLRSVVSGRVSA
ncbi:MAG TPA: sigma-70 family RNA polymerase sigma factor [Phycisphaerales bacterium]|nr:sigma-70 family RNA polymerase sigma factor [Phycisphaerales bacterium]